MLTWVTVLIARIRAFFHVADDDREFTQELDAHVEMAVEEYVRRGMPQDQARRRARQELGGVTQLREAHREVRGLPRLDTILQDLRYALRTLRRDARFTVFAIVIIGLGIAASATVFSVINAVLLRPLPFRDADRLVWISNGGGSDSDLLWSTEPAHYLDLQAQNRSFAELAAYNRFYGVGDAKLTGDGDPERLTVVSVSGNFLSFLGVQPIGGRLFTTEESQPNGPRVVLLSHDFWTRHFAADPSVVGRAITLNERPCTIVGILPASFDFGTVFNPGTRIDLFAPYPLTPQTGGGNTVAILGRLAPGATLEQAQAEFTALGRRLRQAYPQRNPVWPKLEPLDQQVNGHFRPALFLLAWAVGVVMLIACANLSNLQLARMASRQQELAIRIALGAGRGRVFQQLLTESLVLSGLGAMLGLALTAAGTRIVSHVDAFNIPLLERVQLDAAAFGFVALIAVITGLTFGLMPALQIPALRVQSALKEQTRGSSVSRKHAWVRSALVVFEVAFACVLLVVAGLLIRSLQRVLDVQLGFRPERVATLRIEPPRVYDDQAKRNTYFDDALRRIRAMPGIGDAAVTDVLPLDDNRAWAVSREDQEFPRQATGSFIRLISEGYFETMGIARQSGRDYTPHDTPSTEPVVIVNDLLARTLWPGQDPLGKRLRFGDKVRRRVIGVVAAVRHETLEGGLTNEAYLPIRQIDDDVPIRLVVRTDLAAAALSSSVRAALTPIAPDLPMRDWRTLDQVVGRQLSPRRFVVRLLTGFSAFALVLASLGIYALISYGVLQRQQEIAIRMALGASARDVQRRIMQQTLRLAGMGLLIGVAASWLLGRALTSMLFGVTPRDPLTFGAMALLLAIVAAIAGYLPARRVSRIDPITALRAS